MCHSFFEGLGLAPFCIHVMREEVAAVARVDHEIGLGNRATRRLADGVELVVFEVDRLLVHLALGLLRIDRIRSTIRFTAEEKSE